MKQGKDDIFMTTTREGKSLAEILRKAREAKGLSMGDIEKATGISSSYICRLEKSNRDNLSVFYFIKFARLFGWPVTILEELYPDSFIGSGLEKLSSLDEIVLKNDFIFAGVKSDIDMKIAMQKFIRQMESYIISDLRDEEIRLLKELDNLKEQILKSV